MSILKNPTPKIVSGVLVASLGTNLPHGSTIFGSMETHASYPAGSHEYPVWIVVIEGRGTFFHNGEYVEYGPLSVFEIGADIQHAFIKVKEATTFIKHIPDLRVSCPTCGKAGFDPVEHVMSMLPSIGHLKSVH